MNLEVFTLLCDIPGADPGTLKLHKEGGGGGERYAYVHKCAVFKYLLVSYIPPPLIPKSRIQPWTLRHIHDD